MIDLPTTMRAQRLDTATSTVSVQDVPVPAPGPGEVLIKVAYCAICHSDLSLIDGTFPARSATITQGHEASGTIAALGPGVAVLPRPMAWLLNAVVYCAHAPS